ncbi:hypothetical protein D3C76_1864480 [compost metagenome]
MEADGRDSGVHADPQQAATISGDHQHRSGKTAIIRKLGLGADREVKIHSVNEFVQRLLDRAVEGVA